MLRHVAVGRALGLAVIAIAMARAAVASEREAAADEDPLASVPQIGQLATTVQAYLIVFAQDHIGDRAPIKLGRSGPVWGTIIAIDERGVRAQSRVLEINATWKALGAEGLYLLARSLLSVAPPEALSAHILLGLRIGETDRRQIRKELDQLRAVSPEEAERLRAIIDDARRRVADRRALKNERAPESGDGEEADEGYREYYEFVPPKDLGHVDVKTDYGAVGDGIHDDTVAIQKAISEHLYTNGRMLYFPVGTYLVSDWLIGVDPEGVPWQGMHLFGQHRTKTIIKLKDNCPGFTDPKTPRPVIKPTSRQQMRGGNMGHWNYVINMTIDTGSRNSGAVGVEYIASNNGAMREVTIRSGDGGGVCGIDLTMPWPGPCLIKNVHIVGFDYGIKLDHWLYSVTFEHIRLEKQRVAGIKNDHQIVCMRKLRSANAVPAIVSTGMLILLDSELVGAGATHAIQSSGYTYLRNVTARGYAGVIAGHGARVAEHISRPVQSQFPSPQRSLCLPIEDTPFVPYDPPQAWARASGNAASIQSAIDSGKPTVYITGGGSIDRTVVIRGNVRRIFNVGGLSAGTRLGDAPAWRYEGSVHPAVVMEFGGYPTLTVQHASKNALVIRHCGLVQTNTPGCGPLFIEDMCSGPWVFEHEQRVYARHLNIECDEFDLKNNAAWLWILGWKTERGGVQIETTGGGFTEVLGGLVYPAGAVPQDRPMFVNHESNVALMVRSASFVQDGLHKVKVSETRGGLLKETDRLDEGLYVGYALTPEQELARREAAAKRSERRRLKPDAASVVRSPAKRKRADAGAIARYDGQLQQVARDVTRAGRRPRFFLSSMRATVKLTAVSEEGALSVAAGQITTDLAWVRMSLQDKKSLALAVSRPGNEGDSCLAAFYLLEAGQTDEAKALLASVPPDAAGTVLSNFD